MKILVTTFSFPDSSIRSYDGRFVLSEVRAYARNGAEVLVLTPHYPGAQRDERLEPGIRVRRFRYFLPTRWQRLKVPGKPIYRPGSLLAFMQIPLLLAAFVLAILRHARAVDIIHAQWTLTGLLALPAKWFFGTPVIITARGSDIRLLPIAVNRFLHRHVDASIDCFRPLPWSAWYKKTYPTRFLSLPLIVDSGSSTAPRTELLAFAGSHPQLFVLLYAGRFDLEKMQRNRLPLLDLIFATSILKVRGWTPRVFFLGQGTVGIEAAMRQAIAENALHDDVTLLGPHLDIAPYARACHLGLGGIGLNGVAQDFILARTPQLLMCTPENQDTPWRDGRNALMIAPGDPLLLANRIQWAMTHRVKIQEIGEQAFADFAEYLADTDRGGRLYLSAFQELLDEVKITHTDAGSEL